LVRPSKVAYSISIIKMLIRVFCFMSTSCDSISTRTIILIKATISTTPVFEINSKFKARV